MDKYPQYSMRKHIGIVSERRLILRNLFYLYLSNNQLRHHPTLNNKAFQLCEN